MKRLAVLVRAETEQAFIPSNVGGLLEGFEALLQPVLVTLDGLRAEGNNPDARHTCDPFDVFEICCKIIADRPFRTSVFPISPTPESISSARNERVEIDADPAAITPLRREVRNPQRSGTL